MLIEVNKDNFQGKMYDDMNSCEESTNQRFLFSNKNIEEAEKASNMEYDECQTISRISDSNLNQEIQQNHESSIPLKKGKANKQSVSRSRNLILELPEKTKKRLFNIENSDQECFSENIPKQSEECIKSPKNNSCLDCLQNQKGLDSPKKSLKSRSRPPSILKVLYPCNEANSQSDFTKQYQQIISKSNKQIGDEETINISDNLQSYENATTNNNNSNSSNLNFELAKCYKQLASNLTMQMIGAAGGGNNDQQNRNYNHQRTSLDQRAMHPNHLIQEMYLNMNGRNIYNTDEDQETFQNFESKLQNLLEQGQQIDQQYNAFVSELTNQLVSRKSLQTKQEGSQINVSSSHKKRLVERLSKFIQMDSHFKKIFLNTSLGNGGGGGGAVANVDSQFSVIMDRMKKYIFYFPQNNYEKVIRQHNQYLYKIKRENQGKNYISFRNKRRNIILQNPQIYNQQQKGFLNNLAIETKLKRIPDMPFQQNPTNLSYGISIRGCSKTPIKFNQLN